MPLQPECTDYTAYVLDCRAVAAVGASNDVSGEDGRRYYGMWFYVGGHVSPGLKRIINSQTPCEFYRSKPGVCFRLQAQTVALGNLRRISLPQNTRASVVYDSEPHGDAISFFCFTFT